MKKEINIRVEKVEIDKECPLCGDHLIALKIDGEEMCEECAWACCECKNSVPELGDILCEDCSRMLKY